MMWLCFLFGLAVGSFINVLALRYDPEKFLLKHSVVSGRSRCPRCGRALKWFELIPLVSFIIQFGRCRSCRERISIQYPLVELLAGLIFVFVPLSLEHSDAFRALNRSYYLLYSVCYILIFLTLLLIALIDLRLRLIPDEADIFLGILGLALVASHGFVLSSLNPNYILTPPSFIGSYSLLFGLSSPLWLNRLAAVLAAAGFFAFLVLITRGRAMGMGDVKLAAALGLVFGWPDIILITILAFITGSLASLGLIAAKRATMKGQVPFVPFLAAGAMLVFFWGEKIVSWYFGLFGMA